MSVIQVGVNRRLAVENGMNGDEKGIVVSSGRSKISLEMELRTFLLRDVDLIRDFSYPEYRGIKGFALLLLRIEDVPMKRWKLWFTGNGCVVELVRRGTQHHSEFIRVPC